MPAPETHPVDPHLMDDQPARERILTDLDTNLLVEAGAGSGKTTLLVGRIVALIARGTPVERIAAVTFTRKAANELRERLQVELEARSRAAEPGSARAERYEHALRELGRGFVGTIHAFCARLLRERPLEAGLDPDFREVSEEDWQELQRDFWRRWIERAKRTDDPMLVDLQRVAIDARELFEAFETLTAYPDVVFPLVDVAPPDTTSCRRALEAVLAEARALMPREAPPDGWDELMRLVRRLELRRRLGNWDDPAAFCAAIEGIAPSHCKLVQKRWSDTKEGKARAKQLAADLLALIEGPIADVLRAWREHRYPIVMRFLQRATEEFAHERRATGQLGFEDLLLLTATLLREHPHVRAALGARWAHVLVDEFQDTDPIQAEVCFLLAADATPERDWRAVTLRPGALFVVGDPKQSIYRFRRADIGTYELVKARIAAHGAVVALTRNFRSTPPIARLVNQHFAEVFPREATDVQAAFRPMQVVKDARATTGVHRYVVRPAANNKETIFAMDAAMVASWIAERIARGERTAGDFLVLTATKEPIAVYARALAERNVPVATTGAPLPQERELRELLLVLRALADPENAVAVAAVLEGLFFGLSPADLFDARQAGLRFVATRRPPDDALPAARALRRLHEWWLLSQRAPADVVLERIVDETGLLAYAASQPLGDVRAGALLRLVEVVRAGSTLGVSGLGAAVERIELELNGEAPDAPLLPGRTDRVRVMNVHKAKGLEAEVVVLAAPVDARPWPSLLHVRRGATGEATGGMCITADKRILAHPPGWAAMAEAEDALRGAERARLLYVAATRAKQELVVAQCQRSTRNGPVPDESMWSPLAPALESLATPIELPIAPAPGRRQVTRDHAVIAAAIADAEARRRTAADPSLTLTTVTESAKGTWDEARPMDVLQPPGANAGAAWGRAVHRAIEALGRGRRDESLRAFIRAVALHEGLTDAQRDELDAVIAAVAGSAAWQRLLVHGAPRVELPVMRSVRDAAGERVTEGVVDAAVLGREGWVVVDWKTDAVEGERWRERLARYTRQVDAYAEILGALTGAPARGTVERIPRGAGGA
ncbi:MAG: UvrD-helicase domain-containing protein [Gemmatimonadaceae bacterium]|nr:UvrD-helicase domain-containing protein [Gemmatimonadaceae bacterium]